MAKKQDMYNGIGGKTLERIAWRADLIKADAPGA